jgi:YHS domain-containing protein
MITKHWTRLSIVIILSLTACAAHAQKASAAFFHENGVALKGYDVVSYFQTDAPQKGDKAYQFEWGGVTWHFSNLQNLEQFKEDPARFTPQYGGWCAYGMSNNYKAPTDPVAWTIIDNKLYLNYNRKVQEEWSKKTEEFINRADRNWEVLKDQHN